MVWLMWTIPGGMAAKRLARDMVVATKLCIFGWGFVRLRIKVYLCVYGATTRSRIET